MSPRPVVDALTEEAYEALEPLARLDAVETDEALGWPLLVYLSGWGAMIAPLAELVRDDGDHPGWSAIFDVDRAPAEWLPWLAQAVGVRDDPSLDDASRRLRIRETDGQKRGSPGAVEGAARQHLTGTRTVTIIERDGSAYRLTVTTYAPETPDPDKVLAALRAQKPAGIVLTYQVREGQSYDQLRDDAGGRTYAEVLAEFADYNDVRTTLPE